MAPQADVDDAHELGFVCARCGRPIMLVFGDEGALLVDRTAFLSAHQRCMQRSGAAAELR